MGGPFDWGGNKSDGAGGKQKLPRHIERMQEGLRGPTMKSGEGNLPWGGKPAEQKKAYATGTPKNKGSMLSKTGERKGGGKATQGFSKTINSKSQKT